MYARKIVFGVVLLFIFCLSAAAADSEVALMSVGQSPDAMMVRVLLRRMKVESHYDAMFKESDLTNQKVLIAVIGGSSKGLGAAGIDKEEELNRAKRVFDAAKSKGVRILAMHVGGEGRRGELSDFFVVGATPYGEKIIVVKGGNEDGMFDKLKGADVPIITVDKIQDAQAPLAAALEEWL